MLNGYVKLGFAALLPVLFAIILYTLDHRTPFGKIPRMIKQIIYGIIFGFIAILGTEYGIPINGAQTNVRDAAVLTAGLLFGAPAGIIAGLIGGIERWIAVAWGIGTFTRVACTVSTIIAGFYAAALRKFMFENKKPGVLLSFAIGVVMEIIHLTMVFITNMATPDEAMSVVRACTAPMVIANALSIMLATLALTLFRKEKIGFRRSSVRISQTIQRWLLVTVAFAFAATTYFVFSLQTTLATTQRDSYLSLALDEISADIEDASDANLLAITHQIADQLDTASLQDLAAQYNVAEINLVNRDGEIIESTDPVYLGYNMTSGEQSDVFVLLLGNATELVQDYGPISFDENTLRKYAGVKIPSGFVQVGYDAYNFQRDIAATVADLTKNRHVGETGFIVIMDEAMSISSIPQQVTSKEFIQSLVGIDLPAQRETFGLTLNEEACYCQYRITEGYYIISVLPKSEAMKTRNVALYVNTFMEVLVFAILFALIYLLIKKVVVNRIADINESLSKITGGDLGVVVNVRSNEEFVSLSDDINTTVDTLKTDIAEASARIDKELEFAKSIQSSALPNVFPAFPKRKDIDIFASMTPAKEVGGDFYDFYLTNNNRLNFLIADVSGKGIPAAMFMMRAKTELKSLTEADLPISTVFTHGNEALCEGNDAGMFVTAWQGGIDLLSGHVLFANAGHNPPLIKHGNEPFAYLRSKVGFVLAGMDGVQYKTQELDMAPGDIIYLYTDGVTEATDADQQLYGEDRLLSAINSREFGSMEELCKYVKSDVDAFVGDAPQFDDITMVAFKYLGQPPVPSIHFDRATLEDITAVTQFVEETLEKLECPMKTVIQFNVAVDELFSNIVRYGYKDTSGPVTVELRETEDPHGLAMRFIDEGIPYNPVKKEDPDVTLSAEDRKIGGLGIFMVKKTMDDMKYEYVNGKNILTIFKKF